MWTPANRKKIYNTVPPEGSDEFECPYDMLALRGDSLEIKELTISHLADYNDPNLIQSKAWNKLLQLPTLTDLKLLVGEEHISNVTIRSTEKYDFFRALPTQWLTPSVVQKLQVLSLFYTDYWGWFPRMDLDQLGDLPNLKVLALGRYVFVGRKSADWIASLGRNNKSGGLEELYLDECLFLFLARQYGPFTKGGYPVPRNVMDGIDNNTGLVQATDSTRWNHVLSNWRVTMKGLKKFVMGVGERSSPFRTRTAAHQQEPFTEDMEDDPPEYYFGHNRHRFFAHPEPENPDTNFLAAYHSRRDKAKEIPMGNYLLGEGLDQRRRAQMQYARYDVNYPGKWSIGNERGLYCGDRGWAPKEGSVKLDNAAYASLMDAIRDRQ